VGCEKLVGEQQCPTTGKKEGSHSPTYQHEYCDVPE